MPTEPTQCRENKGVSKSTMWQTYHTPTTLTQALDLLHLHSPNVRLVAGGTDLVLEIERGARHAEHLIDITRIPGLDFIELRDDGLIHIGPTATHNQAVASPCCVQYAFPLAKACWEVGAPQIRNRGTIVGNVVTASPANDTIPPLWALDAQVTLRDSNAERSLSFEEFYEGVRKTAMRDDEMVVDVSFSPLRTNQRGAFVKLGLRRAQAISVVNVAVVITFDRDVSARVGAVVVNDARIALGSVGPTIVRATEAEDALKGKSLEKNDIEIASELAAAAIRPISDVRGSAQYRRHMAKVLTARALSQVSQGIERDGFPPQPVMLWSNTNGHFPVWGGREGASDEKASGAVHSRREGEPIDTVVNGKHYRIEGANHKTLLRMLREDIGLTGTKEGCAEGECGACTVLLDGIAVMSCLVPAPRAHGSTIVTIEGLGGPGSLHPIQQAFIEQGAAQCGYCTPGFIVSGSALLQENPSPTRDEIKQALTGNLCRCTGYYSIINAIEQAAGCSPTSEHASA
jgi:xanthine dehydrogenase iron-sulfur cluster and FAD-binding subunit A